MVPSASAFQDVAGLQVSLRDFLDCGDVSLVRRIETRNSGRIEIDMRAV